jgi:hypothetical protein
MVRTADGSPFMPAAPAKGVRGGGGADIMLLPHRAAQAKRPGVRGGQTAPTLGVNDAVGTSSRRSFFPIAFDVHQVQLYLLSRTSVLNGCKERADETTLRQARWQGIISCCQCPAVGTRRRRQAGANCVGKVRDFSRHRSPPGTPSDPCDCDSRTIVGEGYVATRVGTSWPWTGGI